LSFAGIAGNHSDDVREPSTVKKSCVASKGSNVSDVKHERHRVHLHGKAFTAYLKKAHEHICTVPILEL